MDRRAFTVLSDLHTTPHVLWPYLTAAQAWSGSYVCTDVRVATAEVRSLLRRLSLIKPWLLCNTWCLHLAVRRRSQLFRVIPEYDSHYVCLVPHSLRKLLERLCYT